LEWNLRLKSRFPRHLIGELELTESEFQELLGDLRAFGQHFALKRPPRAFPFVTLAAMTFTARYDYDGAFWPVFFRNIEHDDIDQSAQAAWGEAFLTALDAAQLFQPPERRRKYVFPILFHSIVPERFRESFGTLVRGICDTMDIREINDDELAELLADITLPDSLHTFVTGKESRAIAIELVRHVSEDYRLGVMPDLGTLRGRILEAARQATDDERRRFRPHVHPLPWRWDFNSGRFGVWLATGRSYDHCPLYLSLPDKRIDLHAKLTVGEWRLTPALLALPLSLGGTSGRVEADDFNLFDVYIGRAPIEGPFIFRSLGQAGIFESNGYGPPGEYAVVDDGRTHVVDTHGNNIEPNEELAPPVLPGASRAQLFSLGPGDIVISDNRPVFIVHRATRPEVGIRANSLWYLDTDASTEIPVFSHSPLLRFTSPIDGAAYVILDAKTHEVLVQTTFEEEIRVKTELPPSRPLRATVWVDGRSRNVSMKMRPLRERNSLCSLRK
jgi:hypothetical protein